MNTINYIPARCGAGKTQQVLKALATVQEQSPTLTLWASLTTKLSRESYDSFLAINPTNQAVLVDSTQVESVQDELWNLVRNGFTGVVFITHASLLNDTLKGVLKASNVICDEIPTSSIELLHLQQTEQTIDLLVKYCSFTKCEFNTTFQMVQLKDDVAVEQEVIQLVEDHLTGTDTTYSKQFIQILKFLVQGYRVMYYSTVEGRHIFQAVHSQAAETLLTAPLSITILGANLEQTLFGLLAKHNYQANIVPVTSIHGVELEQLHKQKVTIIPYLTSGNWSKTLKDSSVFGSIAVREPEETHTVREDIQQFANRILKKDYLLFRNTTDVLTKSQNELATSNITALSTHVHGINSFRHLDKALFMAAANPKPDELKLLGVASHDLGIPSTDLINAVKTERYYEAAYQCVARTGIRLPVSATTEREFTFVVPDMATANYIAERFEEGCVTIDTTKGYSLSLTAKQQTRVQVQEAKELEKKLKSKDDADKRKQTVIALLMDKKAKVDTMPNLLKKHGVSESSFKRYKKEFKEELQALKLIK